MDADALVFWAILISVVYFGGGWHSVVVACVKRRCRCESIAATCRRHPCNY
jgi:hypothetical protein